MQFVYAWIKQYVAKQGQLNSLKSCGAQLTNRKLFHTKW